MAVAAHAVFASDRAVGAARVATLNAYVRRMESLDAAQDWAAIVTSARSAGLPKETFLLQFSCAWSTVTRWMAGQSMPGPFARDTAKARLVELVAGMRDEEAARWGVPASYGQRARRYAFTAFKPSAAAARKAKALAATKTLAASKVAGAGGPKPTRPLRARGRGKEEGAPASYVAGAAKQA